MRPWSKDYKELLNELGTDEVKGLSVNDARKALELFGPNILTDEVKDSSARVFLRQLHNPVVYLLLAAAGVSLALGEHLNGAAIFAIVVLNAFIGFFQEVKASSAIAALKRMSVPKARVIRDGKVHTIPSSHVVPGDLLLLEAGDYVTADARIINPSQLTVDEASLTGESIPVSKIDQLLPAETPVADRVNIVHAGSAISTGTSRAVVTATGMHTEIGKIAGLLNETAAQITPLQKKLQGVSNKLLVLGLMVIAAVVIIRFERGDTWFAIFMAAISLSIAAIPEGLPTVVTIALTLAVRRLTRKGAIVRNLNAVETLGSTNIICTDKTGTLTTGEMTVRDVFIAGDRRDTFLQALILCNNASLDHGGSGDSTEVALLRFVDREAAELVTQRHEVPRLQEWSFDSRRKRMSVLIQFPGRRKIITKGAPESLLSKCLLGPEEKQNAEAVVSAWAAKGYRVLAVGEKVEDVPVAPETAEENLTFLGLVAIADPPKPESLQAIKECREAGIRVIMITGDHPLTAGAIANELGLTGSLGGTQVMTGAELETLPRDELKEKVSRIDVFARVTPEHKLRIVEALQLDGSVVAMTGDGVNDAPALKKSQIGVAMGKGGTEVARQAATMVLTDDNFSTIVSAVEEGRAIFGNIRRTIQYLLSTNLAEILIVLGASLLNLPVPFSPLTLLWINLVTDGFPSLALAAEPLDKDILRQMKRPSPESFFNQAFLVEVILVGVTLTVMCLWIYTYSLKSFNLEVAKSHAFSFLVFAVLLRSFSCRSETKSYIQLPLNWYHLAAVSVPVLLQLLVESAPFSRNLLSIGPVSLTHNFILFLLALIPLTLTELLKLRKSP